jgi:ACR3 family arsenite transporter
MSVFERYLTLWVGLAIVAGIGLGQVFPDIFQAVAALEVASVNLPVALLIWAMIIPMLVKIDFRALGGVAAHWRGISVTLFANWAVKPFTMALLGWVFIGWLFRPLLPEAQIESYIAGLILLGAAPCTAMVFVWSHLTKGDAPFTLSQVALNDTVMVVAFAPIVALLLGLSAIIVPWATLLLSVALYILAPVAISQVLRVWLVRAGRLEPFLSAVQPVVIALLAVPIIIQTYFIFGLAYLLNRATGEIHGVAGPSALIGASNFFELAVAAAISLFGLQSGAALATVVGVLIEVPVMLTLVALVNRSRPWYEAGRAVRGRQAAETQAD